MVSCILFTKIIEMLDILNCFSNFINICLVFSFSFEYLLYFLEDFYS